MGRELDEQGSFFYCKLEVRPFFFREFDFRKRTMNITQPLAPRTKENMTNGRMPSVGGLKNIWRFISNPVN